MRCILFFASLMLGAVSHADEGQIDEVETRVVTTTLCPIAMYHDFANNRFLISDAVARDLWNQGYFPDCRIVDLAVPIDYHDGLIEQGFGKMLLDDADWGFFYPGWVPLIRLGADG